jgi:hypothetical protein
VVEVSDAHARRKHGTVRCPMPSHGGPSHAIPWDFMGQGVTTSAPPRGSRGQGRGGSRDTCP